MTLPPGAQPRTFGGITFYLIMASDVARDGMSLELHTQSDGSVAAEVFYDDASGQMTVWTADVGVPLEAMEHLIETARKRLPPAP